MSNEKFSKSVKDATDQILNNLAKSMARACIFIEGEAKKNIHTDMGILAASMGHVVKVSNGKIIGRVYNTAEYAAYVHQGTGIYAKDGNGRKTPWCYVVKSGKYKGGHYTRGQKPNPFLDDAKTRNIKKINNILGGA